MVTKQTIYIYKSYDPDEISEMYSRIHHPSWVTNIDIQFTFKNTPNGVQHIMIRKYLETFNPKKK